MYVHMFMYGSWLNICITVTTLIIQTVLKFYNATKLWYDKKNIKIIRNNTNICLNIM